MKKSLLSAILLTILIVAFTGCATIVSDSTYPVSITSDPNEAKITIRSSRNIAVYQGKTPAVVNLPSGDGFFKKASYTVTFSKPGFEDSIYTLTANIDGWYWGNILLGGIIGMLIVDPATGAMWQLDPQIFVEMKPIASNNSLSIMDINDIPDSWKNHLIKIS